MGDSQEVGDLSSSLGKIRRATKGVAMVSLSLGVAAAAPANSAGALAALRADIERQIFVSLLDQEACISDEAGPFMIPHSAHAGLKLYDPKATPLPRPNASDRPWEFALADMSEYLGFWVADNLRKQNLIVATSDQTMGCAGGRAYTATPRLLQTAVANGCQPNGQRPICFHGYDLGSWKISASNLINSYQAPDPRTGAVTMHQSYRVTFYFAAKPPFTFTASALVLQLRSSTGPKYAPMGQSGLEMQRQSGRYLRRPFLNL